MSARKILQRLLGLALVATALSACQTIAGIEDRKLDPNAGKSQASTKLCKDYCTLVMDACQDDNAVYTTTDVCMGICAQLDPGDANEYQGTNSVECRYNQAKAAKLEPDTNCVSAGPGGGGQCGSDCDAYCTLFPKVCPDQTQYPTNDSCLQACSGLTDQKTFNLKTDHGGDTIECRLVHVSAATADPTTHCPHAPILPTQPWCTGPATAAPTCDEYCQIELAACTDDLQQYDDVDECLAVCKTLTPGTNADTTGNTIGCRRYHSFSATLAATTHCYHSGPSGDGHCGDADTGNCDSYCAIVAAACPDEFKGEYVNAKGCSAACAKLPEHELDSQYTLQSAMMSTGLQCRTLNATRAFKDPKACVAAVGGGACK